MNAGCKPRRVHILMAVYNGADHLPEQLQSIAAQNHADWHLVVSDDRSTDGSAAQLAEFASSTQSVEVITGPGQGAGANFLHLLRHAATQPDVGWIAFADQDDVWLPHKLERALAHLSEVDADHPALYCSRSLIAGPDLSGQRLSSARAKPPGFRNALVQNIAAGNTIVLNPAAVRLVLTTVAQIERVVVHDWWVYQMVSGAGGTVLHDETPGLIYRQHADNQIGANDSFLAKLRRIGLLLRGE
mmetsp:Transcript_18386/g.29712  ORF Transcript_18386/g.29712 Transcript_18386/m.29712 type:complete len:244 (-) Transcript_18386:11-742(-)